MQKRRWPVLRFVVYHTLVGYLLLGTQVGVWVGSLTLLSIDYGFETIMTGLYQLWFLVPTTLRLVAVISIAYLVYLAMRRYVEYLRKVFDPFVVSIDNSPIKKRDWSKEKSGVIEF
jgi:hypothetical protein